MTMAKSKSAKRRKAQNRTAQRHAEKRAHRSQSTSRKHLPKVGTKPDTAYVARRRREDVVDFGLGSRHSRTRRTVGVVIVAVAVVTLLLFLLLAVA
jgi:hypothetical protein